jgi:hypothetical protein
MTRKNLFSINTSSKRAVGIDNETFVLQRESTELSAKRDSLNEELANAMHKTIKKSLLRLLPAFLGCGLGVILGSVAFEIFESKEVFPAALGIVAGMLFVAGIVYGVINGKKQKENEDKPDEGMEELDDKYEAFNAEVKRELGIPEDAPQVDILTYMYSLDDKTKKTVYSGDTANVFIEDGKLCFWYGEAVVGFPMSEIEALVKVNEPITFEGWMPDDPHDSLKYAQYDIEKKEVDYDEHYTMKGYYSLRLTHEGEPFELLFPLFDAEKLLKLLDLEIVEE